MERTLTAEDLLICDAADRPVGLAGIMGGGNSEIDDATTDVLLEMAWFHPIGIVRSSRRHKLSSEAASRFVKGTDPEVIDLAMRRFADLLGVPLEEGAATDTGELPERAPVRVRPARVAKLLGTDLGAARMQALLEPIGFATTPAGDDLEVAIPSWRYDSATEIDVIEEVARHHGYTALGRSVPKAATAGRLSERQHERRRLRGALVGWGLSEAMPMPFLAPGELARCGLGDEGIRITNPLVADQSILRTSLLPGLVGAVAYNSSHRNHGVRLFEIGHTFNRPADADAELPDEREYLAAVVAGAEAPVAIDLWRTVAEILRADDVRIENAERARAAPHPLGPPRRGRVEVGALGEVDPGVLEAHAIGERVAYLEVDLDALHAPRTTTAAPALQPLPQQRHRPRLRGRRGRPRLRGRGRHPRRGGRAPVAGRPLRRLPRRGAGRRPPQPCLHPPPAGHRPHPHRRRRGRGPRADHRRRAHPAPRHLRG